MKRFALGIAISGSAACAPGGEDDPPPAEEGCGYVEREVSLDADFGGETPRDVMALLERPVEGPVTWHAGENDYIAVGGATGEAQFHAEAIAGPTAWVREGRPGMGGVVESRIFCPTEFLFEAIVRMETSDGALVEEWRGNATYTVSGALGADGGIAVEVADPRPFGGTLSVEEREGLEEQWESRALLVHLYFITYPLNFVGMSGEIRHYVSNTDLNDGASEGVGATSEIAEFRLPPT